MSKLIRYTPEQADVLDYLTENDGGMLLVAAKAGCGKSFMAKRVVEELSIKTGLYTAFNRSIVEEMGGDFEYTGIECRTLHSVAYKYVKPTLEIQDFTYKSIVENVPYTDKRRIIDALNSFFISSSDCIYDYFEKYFHETSRSVRMTAIAISYVEKMAEGSISPTFNFLLKSLHLMLAEKTVVINVGIVILDELADSTPVAIEIFKLIEADIRLGLGDNWQSIYSFMNLVDGFDVLKNDAKILNLTQSHRCSVAIAERVEAKMQKVLHKDFAFKGTDNPYTDGRTLYCTLTNAAIINKIVERLEEGKSFTLLRKPSDIFAPALAVASASAGKVPYQKKYAYLVDLYSDYGKQQKYKTYQSFLLSELDDVEINGAVRLLSKLREKGINLFSLYKEVKDIKSDPKFVLSTCFTAKGLSMETVYIDEGFENKFREACNGEISDEEEALTIKKCMYVACTRAGKHLYTAVL